MCLNVKRFTKSFRNRYLFPAIITLYNCSKPQWRMIENMNCKINLLENVYIKHFDIELTWYFKVWTWFWNDTIWKIKKLTFTTQSFYILYASFIIYAKPHANGRTIVGCYMLRPFTHILWHFLACFWELLHPFAHHCQRGSNTIRLTVFRA